MDVDISKLLAGIPALDEFNAEPGTLPGLDQVSAQERVQSFLAGRIGGEWAECMVFVYALPGGAPLYLACGPSLAGPFGLALTIVCEDQDGQLCLADPQFLDVDGRKADPQRAPTLQIVPDLKAQQDAMIHAQQRCLSKILPRLPEISTFIKNSDGLTQYRKKVWRRALSHAAEHLNDQLDDMQDAQESA